MDENKAYQPMDIKTILEQSVIRDVKDIFVVAGLPITYKIGNTQERMDRPKMLPDDIRLCVDDIYEISRRPKTNLDNGLEADPTPVPFNTHGTVYALSRTYTNHDPTGVFAVDNEEKSPSQWFDLLGRKAEKPKKNAPASSFKGNVILWK